MKLGREAAGAVVVGLLICATGLAETVHIRGENYDGIDPTTKLSLPWPETGPTVLWRRPIGNGYSGVVIVGKRVYTQYQRRDGQMVACLDLHSGGTVWETRYNWPWQPDGKWPGPYATPTYSDGRVYFSGAMGLVGCVDAQDGRMLWSRNLVKEFESKGVHFGYSGTPLVMFGKVYLPVGGKECALIALDASDGSTVWEAGGDRASYTSLIPVAVGGTTQIVSYLAIATYGSDPESGETLWYNLWGSGYSPHGTWPLYREPFLFRTHPFRRGCRLDRISRTGDKFSLEPVWVNKQICGDFFSPLLIGDHVYGFDVRTPQVDRDGSTRGEFACIEFETGEERWRTNAPGHCAVAAADGKLILLNESGELIIVDADPEQYTELARHRVMTGEICWTMPTLRANYLVVRNQSEAVCVYLGSDPPDLRSVGSAPVDYGSPHWLDAYDSQTTWMPDYGNLSMWFLSTLLVVFVPASLIAAALRRYLRPINLQQVFFAIACVLGVLGTRALSSLARRFILTWPAVLFLCLIWIQVYAARARISNRVGQKVVARLLLLLFAGLCTFYWYVCGRLFLLGGWGFLTGFAAAVPFFPVLSRRLANGRNDIRTLMLLVAAFAGYFWLSAIILVWKASLETSLNVF